MADIWKSKLAAWVHDPAEKALILLRTKEGHEGGTSLKLRNMLFHDEQSINGHEKEIREADRWASAADRLQFPKNAPMVRFASRPVLVHPLSGDKFKLTTFHDIKPKHLEAVSFDHFENLIHYNQEGTIDYKRTFLAFWRFGPESPAKDIGFLWGHLPADTRTPDHSIWEHLRLTSAFAGCFAGGRRPCLFSLSIGPVQSFIAQARSTSDLWAGSHLLSSISWEALSVVCDKFGPDSVIFPDLQGVPAVDRWLKEDIGVEFPERCVVNYSSDYDPLFTAAIPNRFLAVIPDGEGERLATAIESKVKDWIEKKAKAAWQRIHRLCSLEYDENSYALEQIERHFRNFPQTKWVSVPWPACRMDARGKEIDTTEIEQAFRAIAGDEAFARLSQSNAWKLLKEDLSSKTAEFFRANPGVLYPAIYKLLGYAMDSAKRVRTFSGTCENGYRCSMCGEREWLTFEKERLTEYRGKGQQAAQPWRTLSEKSLSMAHKGEHLCAVCMLKRVWPSLFAEDVAQSRGGANSRAVRRYVVSTHTMALIPTIEYLFKKRSSIQMSSLEQVNRLADLVDDKGPVFVALPRKSAGDLYRSGNGTKLTRCLARIPAWLEEMDEKYGDDPLGLEKEEKKLDQILRKLGTARQSYYGIILLDGDSMGKWLDASARQLAYKDLWHDDIESFADRLAEQDDGLKNYVGSPRPATPAYHTAISRALNGFAIHATRFIVEECYAGKVIYAGGDDLLAMINLADLLPCLLTLRHAYSGTWPDSLRDETFEMLRVYDRRGTGGNEGLNMKNGFLHFRQDEQWRLFRMMGKFATASVGAVIAHCMSPLGLVLRQLRASEKRAKDAGRNAFSISLMKRSGNINHFTGSWQPNSGGHTDLGLVIRLRDIFARYSGRKTAYHIRELLNAISDETELLDQKHRKSLIKTTFLHQFKRHSAGGQTPQTLSDFEQVAEMAADLAVTRQSQSNESSSEYLAGAIELSEFLARLDKNINKRDGGE